MRICCDPCTDPAAVTLRDGTKVLHFTNLPRGGTWGPFEFGFYEPVDPDDEESEPNLDAPIDLTGSTWALIIYSEDSDGSLLPFGSFDVWDLDDASDGLCSAHPLVAGSRAVLRPDWRAKRALTPDERTLVNALRADTGKGVIVSDRTDPTRGSNLRSCMDPRVTLGDLGIYLSDFLVLNAA